MGFFKKELTGDLIVFLIESATGYKDADRHMNGLKSKCKQNPEFACLRATCFRDLNVYAYEGKFS